jgi:hypothetical protein
MKKILLIIGILGFVNGAFAQSIIDKLYEKYSGAEGYTSVYISKYMFDMFRSNNNPPENAGDIDKVISKLNCIKILVTDDDPATPVPVDLYGEMMKVLPGSAYKEIMVVREKDQNIKFFTKESKGRVVELLMVIGGKAESVLISIQGEEIDMKNISKLAREMNIEGMDKLQNMK